MKIIQVVKLEKAVKPYTRTRRGKLERVKGHERKGLRRISLERFIDKELQKERMKDPLHPMHRRTLGDVVLGAAKKLHKKTYADTVENPEYHPIPAKTALAMMKMIQPEFRLPLCEMKKENQSRLKLALKNLGLLP